MTSRLLMLLLLLPAWLGAQVVRDQATGPDLEAGRVFHQTEGSEAATSARDSVDLADFTLAFILPWEASDKDQVLLDASEKGSSCRLVLTRDRRVKLELRTGANQSTILSDQVLPPTHWRLVVVASVKRDARQAVSGLWVNGLEAASAAVHPGVLKMDLAKLRDWQKAQRLDIYDRALSRVEILNWGKSDKARTGRPYLALVGGSEAVALVEDGTFEALSVGRGALAPSQEGAANPFAIKDFPRLRSLAWETDTVLRQDRPLNFGPLEQQLDRTEMEMAMLIFGRQECLELGEAGLAEFRAALTDMVARCRGQVAIVALVGSVPFEKKPSPLPDRSTLNPALKKYQQVMQEVAAASKIQFLDVFSAWPPDATGFTTDGVQLSAAGRRLYGEVLYRVLFKGFSAVPADAEVMRVADQLRPLIQTKNKLWHEYWRPSNWAFLYGDRTAQPSSRDHLNPQVRWFPKELEKYRQLIQQKEEEIAKQADELRRKVP